MPFPFFLFFASLSGFTGPVESRCADIWGGRETLGQLGLFLSFLVGVFLLLGFRDYPEPVPWMPENKHVDNLCQKSGHVHNLNILRIDLFRTETSSSAPRLLDGDQS